MKVREHEWEGEWEDENAVTYTQLRLRTCYTMSLTCHTPIVYSGVSHMGGGATTAEGIW